MKTVTLKKKKTKNNNILIQNQQSENNNVNSNSNNRTLLVGCSFSGKTNFMLKILPVIQPDPDFYIITKMPSEQFRNSRIEFEEIGEQLKPLNEYKTLS